MSFQRTIKGKKYTLYRTFQEAKKYCNLPKGERIDHIGKSSNAGYYIRKQRV